MISLGNSAERKKHLFKVLSRLRSVSGVLTFYEQGVLQSRAPWGGIMLSWGHTKSVLLGGRATSETKMGLTSICYASGDGKGLERCSVLA